MSHKVYSNGRYSPLLTHMMNAKTNPPKGEILTVPRALIEECRDALAEEMAAYDIDPPLHHLQQAYEKCVAALAA
jgi:hypothetical protein